MKRILRTIAVVVLLVAIAVSITACGGPKKEDIVGHWEVYDRVLNFDPDGKFTISSSREYSGGNYSLEELRALAQEYRGEGSWEIYGNTVKTSSSKYGFIDFTYKDGKLIDGKDEYIKKDVRLK